MGSGIGSYKNLQQFDGQAGFYEQQETVTRTQLEDFWKSASENTKREIKGLVLYRTEPEIEIENQRLNRSESGELIETAGNMNLVIPGKLMAGSFVTDSDRDGCVMSRKAAEAIFGDRDIIGEKVLIGKKEYIIRGIVDLDKILCMIQGDDEKSYPYIRVEAPKIPLSVVEQILSGLILESCEWVSEGNLYYGIGSILLCLPLWILLFIGLFRYRKIVPKIENKILNYILKTMTPVAGFAGACALFLFSFRFSDDYIPTAWSDFEFWTELIQQKKEMICVLLENPVQTADGIMLSSLMGVIGTSIVFMFCILVIHNRKFTLK